MARKDKATPPSTISAATSEKDDSGGVDEDEGELKLTGNVFLAVSHQYTVTLESVLMGMHNKKVLHLF